MESMTCDQFPPKPLILNDRDFYFKVLYTTTSPPHPVPPSGGIRIGLPARLHPAKASLLEGLRSRPWQYSSAERGSSSVVKGRLNGVFPQPANSQCRRRSSGLLRPRA